MYLTAIFRTVTADLHHAVVSVCCAELLATPWLLVCCVLQPHSRLVDFDFVGEFSRSYFLDLILGKTCR